MFVLEEIVIRRVTIVSLIAPRQKFSRINICRKTVDETEQLCGLIARDILKAHLENPLPESEELIAYAIEGLWYADPTLNADAIVSLMNDMTGAKC